MLKPKRFLAAAMAAMMMIPSISLSSDRAYAEDTIAAETQETASEEILETVILPDTEEVSEPVTEAVSKDVSEDDISEEMYEKLVNNKAPKTEETVTETTEDTSNVEEEAKADSEEVTEAETQEELTEAVTEETTEAVTENEEKQPSFTSAVNGVSTNGIDFSSCELLVGTEDTSIFTWDTTVVSGYGDVYLLRFDTAEETKNAYTYYFRLADFVSANIIFTVSDEDDVQAGQSDINTGDDALANLNELDPVSVPAKTIAVIDTGINATDLVDSVSVIGESASDDNGHGTKMYNYIKEEYPSAKVLSIKALGSDGTGQASDIYAAIQYAIESRVDIISLSVSAFSTARNDVIREAIENAIEQDIIVVGAAGNSNSNARYYLPGSIEKAVIVGACDEYGNLTADSNFGSTVDYNVPAESTSEAAARMSALIAANRVNDTTVFTNLSSGHEEEDVVRFVMGDDNIHTAYDYTGNGYSYTMANTIDYSFSLSGKITESRSTIFGTTTWSANSQLYIIGYGKTWPKHMNGQGTEVSASTFNGGNLIEQTGISCSNPAGSTFSGGYAFCSDPDSDFSPKWSGKTTAYLVTDTSYWKFNEDGTIRVPYMRKGLYASGYSSSNAQSVGVYFYVTYDHTDQPYYAAIYKQNDKGEPVSNVTFDVSINGNAPTAAFTGLKTGADGILCVNLGNYATAPVVKFRENWEDENYTKHSDAYAQVKVYTTEDAARSNAKTQAHTWTNTRYYYIFSIWKDRKDGKGNASTKSLKGIEYTLYDGNNNAIAVFTMDDNGYAKTVNLTTYATAQGWMSGDFVDQPTKETNKYVANRLDAKPSGYYYKETKTNANFELNTSIIAAKYQKRKNLPDSTTQLARKTVNEFTVTDTDVETPEPYYVAFKKEDESGNALNGIPFTMYIDGVKWSTTTIDGTTYDKVYSGWFTNTQATGHGFGADAGKATSVYPKLRASETGKEDRGAYYNGTKWQEVKDGVGIIYLGKFNYVPEVTLVESWDGSAQTPKTIKVNGSTRTEIVVTDYNKTAALDETNGEKAPSLKPTPVKTLAEVLLDSYQAAFTAVNDKNAIYYYVTIKKSTTKADYPSMEGVAYSLFFGNTKTEWLHFVLDKDGNVAKISRPHVISKYILYDGTVEYNGLLYAKIKVIGTPAEQTRYRKNLEDNRDDGANVFELRETNANNNYVLNTDVLERVVLTENEYVTLSESTSAQAKRVLQEKQPVKVYLTKQSANPSCTDNNPNYSLEGTTYEIYRVSDDAKVGKMVVQDKNGSVVYAYDANDKNLYEKEIDGTIKLDANNDPIPTNILDVSEFMTVDPSTGDFKKTEFYAVETAAGRGYELDASDHTFEVTADNTQNNPYHIEVEDEPVDDPLEISLTKTLTGSNANKPVAGAVFRINFYAQDTNENYTFAELQAMTPDLSEEYTTFINDNGLGRVKRNSDGFIGIPRDDDHYPLGYITVEEIAPAAGYQLDGSKAVVGGTTVDETSFCLVNIPEVVNVPMIGDVTVAQLYLVDNLGQRSVGPISTLSGANTLVDVQIDEMPERGDLAITKWDENGDPVANVLFEIKNNATGETHYVVTDDDGNVSTNIAYVAHSVDTNKYTKNTTAYDGKSGVWFERVFNQESTDTVKYDTQAVDDTQCALPVGEYTVTEIKVLGTNTLQKEESIVVTVVKDSVTMVFDSNKTDTEPVIYNVEIPKPDSVAKVILASGQEVKYAPADQTVTVQETFSYTNLKCGTEFTVFGTLWEKTATGRTKVATVRQTFTTVADYVQSVYEADGNIVLSFDNLKLDPGATYVVTDDIYYGNVSEDDVKAGTFETTYPNSNNDVVIFPVSHDDMDDEDQTVYVEGTLQIEKTVDLPGESPAGAKYTVEGTTFDRQNFSYTFTIGADGKSEKISIPYGTYSVKEISGPTGNPDYWTLDPNTYLIEIKGGKTQQTIGVDLGFVGQASEIVIQSEDTSRTYATLVKSTADTTVTNNPNYSLEGAEYKLYLTEAEAKAARDSFDFSNALATFTTKADGTTDDVEVTEWMNGAAEKDFYVVESKAAKNYLRSKAIAKTTVKNTNITGNPAVFAVEDTPVKVNAEVLIQKIDTLTDSFNTAKHQSLDGAQFTVAYYESDITALTYAGTPTSRETFTVQKQDDKYEIKWDKVLNLGWLVIEEIKLPAGYTDDGAYITVDGKRLTGPIVIRMDVEFSDNNAACTSKYSLADGRALSTLEVVVSNTPIRGDLGLIKKDLETGRYMPNVEFEIENTQTGEKHIMKTDANGVATTRTATYTADSVWFSEGEYGKIDPKDGYGALPLGTYKVTELRCAANEGYQLNAPQTVEISENQLYATLETALVEEDGTYYFYNVPNPIIRTQAKVESTDSQTMPQDGAAGQKGEPQTIIDTVEMEHLRANSTYTIVGTLMVVDHGSVYPYATTAGDYVVTKTFTTPATYSKSPYEINQTETMEYTDIYPENYEGCSFVVFNRLYYGTNTTTPAQYEEIAELGMFPLIHEDIDNKNQTVKVADIGTKAEDGVNKDQIVKPEGKIQIVDHVAFTGLTIGESYRISGDLHVTGYTWKDKDGNEIKNVNTDEPLKDAQGNVITASDTFTATTSDGVRDLVFEIDADLLQGQSIVVFEDLYYKDIRLALHADIRDESETIHFPAMHTTLYRAGTGDWAEDLDPTDITKETTVDESSKEVMAAENAVVVDRIKVHNILANREYLVKGILMDKATQQPLVDANGKQVTVTKKYTAPTVNAVPDTNSPHADKFICEDGTVLDMSADHGDYLVDDVIEVTFPAFDASNLGKHTSVAYEELYLLKDGKEILVSEHKDIDDADQAVRFISIGTKATDEKTTTKMVSIDEEVVINDEVEFHNACIGKPYTLTASVIVKNDKSGYYKDGDALKDLEGKPVTATITFTPDATDGTVIVPIKFKGYLTTEMDMVCFEDMSNDKGLQVAVHNSLSDEEQTTYKAWIGTTATVDGSHFVFGDNKVQITDRVEYHNLVPNALKYKVVGKLVRKSDETELGITAEKEFTPTEKDGYIDITFPEFDASGLRGDSVVVFEKLYVVPNDTFEAEIAKHEEIGDIEQTIIFAELHTTLYRAGAEEWVDDTEDDSTKEVMAAEDAEVIDRCVCSNILANEDYILKGILMDKATGKPAVDADGNQITAEKPFSTKGTGTVTETVEVNFKFDATGLGKHTYVAYEELYIIDKNTRKERLVSEHKDIDDHDQTVRFIEIGTKSKTDTETQILHIAGETTIYDEVEFHNACIGKTYSMTATIVVTGDKTGYYKDGDTLKDVKGNVITKTITFVPTETDGTVVVPITFSGYVIPETKLIAFETMKNDKGLTVSVHNDITDREQTTYVVSIGTTADVNGAPVAVADVGVVVRDTVQFHNAVPGLNYRIKGEIVQKSTGKKIGVTAESEVFTAEDTDGEVTITFPAFDASEYKGDSIVCFEKLYLVIDGNEFEISHHEEIDDKGQTIAFPSLQTVASAIETSGNKIVVSDTIQFTNLVPGLSYTAKSTLVKKDGTPVVVDGTPIVAEVTFTPDKADGSVGVSFPAFDPYFEFAADATYKEYTYVVFEELYVNVKETDGTISQHIVGYHKDTNDKKQTVTKNIIITGDDTPLVPLFVLLGLSMAGMVVLFEKKRRIRKKRK